MYNDQFSIGKPIEQHAPNKTSDQTVRNEISAPVHKSMRKPWVFKKKISTFEINWVQQYKNNDRNLGTHTHV